MVVAVILLTSAAARAAHVDFKDPRRALGREDDIKVDAEMIQDTLSPGTAIGVTYQVQNLTSSPIAIADKIAVASFDSDSQTITLSIGAEIPQGAAMPHLSMIAPGQTRSFRAGATPQITVADARGPWAHVPRAVQIIVNVLRDIGPFAKLIALQTTSSAPPMPNDLFGAWVDSVSSVELNALPVHWTEARRGPTAETAGGGF
jgi:hypothetical protein